MTNELKVELTEESENNIKNIDEMIHAELIDEQILAYYFDSNFVDKTTISYKGCFPAPYKLKNTGRTINIIEVELKEEDYIPSNGNKGFGVVNKSDLEVLKNEFTFNGKVVIGSVVFINPIAPKMVYIRKIHPCVDWGNAYTYSYTKDGNIVGMTSNIFLTEEDCANAYEKPSQEIIDNFNKKKNEQAFKWLNISDLKENPSYVQKIKDVVKYIEIKLFTEKGEPYGILRIDNKFTEKVIKMIEEDFLKE